MAWDWAMLGLPLLALAVSADQLAISLPGLGSSSGGAALRVEFLVGIALAVAAMIALRGKALALAGRLEWLLVGWVGANVLSSAIFSPARARSLQLAALLGGLLAIYWAARLLMRSPRAVFWGAISWVVVGGVATFLGLVAALLYTLAGWMPGVSFTRAYDGHTLTLIPMVYGTLWEANIFGSYSLTVVAMAFALGRSPLMQSARVQWALRAVIACAFCGTVISMTRTAWAVGIVLVVALAAFSLWKRLADWKIIALSLLAPAAIGVLAGGAVGYSMPLVRWPTTQPWDLSYQQLTVLAGQAIRDGSNIIGSSPGEPPAGTNASAAGQTEDRSAVDARAGELATLDRVPTLQVREKVLANALDGLKRRPLLGWGTGSYPYVYPPEPGQSDWISNLEAHILFDTGLVGFALFVVAMGMVVWQALRALRQATRAWDTAHYVVFGAFASLVSLFLAYQVTDGLWLGFTWVLLAISVAASRSARRGVRGEGVRDE